MVPHVPNEPTYKDFQGDRKMNIHELLNTVEGMFHTFLQHMEQEEILLAEKDKERILIKLYISKGDQNFPLKIEEG